MTLHIQLFGALQVTVAGAAINLKYDKVRALLAYLAANAHQPHRRATLATLLWADYPESEARRSLNQALFTLRQAIGDQKANPPWLLVNNETVQINPAADTTIDVAQFMTLLDACDKHRHREPADCAECAQRWAASATLYRGDLLQGFSLPDSEPFEEWSVLTREALHQRALAALTHLADHQERCGALEAARQFAQQQVQLEPWREEAHQQLMRVLVASGQRSAALAQYEICKRLLADELGVEPSAATQALRRQIEQGQLTPSPRILSPAALPIPEPPVLNNLPTPLTSFVGRTEELAQVAAFLADPTSNLITLVGPGGMGKTRLALQAAAHASANFPDGVAFVPLAAVTNPAGLVAAVASAIQLALPSDREPQSHLLAWVRDKALLLVLDNFEQLVADDGAIALITELVVLAPRLKLLLTTREPLKLMAEQVLELGGLPLDSTADEGAIDLFVQRAKRTTTTFVPTPVNLPAITRICRLVNGTPLALELAATWVRMLTCDEIADEITRNIDFLRTNARDIPARQRSMRAVFDQSWALLDEQPRAALVKLAIFPHSFARDAAQAVAHTNLSMLSALVSASLVQRTPLGRYILHELTRQYSAEKLHATGQAAALQRQHLHFFLQLAETAATYIDGQTGAAVKPWCERLEEEYENLRAALRYAIAQEVPAALRLCNALRSFWFRSRAHEGLTFFQQALQAAGQSNTPAAVRTVALWSAATLDPDRTRAEELSLASRALAYTIGDQHSLAMANEIIGYSVWHRGDVDQARQCFDEGLRLHRAGNNQIGEAKLLLTYTFLETYAAAYDKAFTLAATALTLARTTDHRDLISEVTAVLGALAIRRSDLAQAAALLTEAIALAEAEGNVGQAAFTRTRLGRLLAFQGHYAQSVAMLEQSINTKHSNMHHAESMNFALLAEVYYFQGDLARARHFGDLALTFDPPNPLVQAFARLFLGMAHRAQGDYGQAQQLLAASADALAKFNDRGSQMLAMQALGRVALESGDVAQARTLLTQSLRASAGFGDRRNVAQCLEALAALAHTEGELQHTVVLSAAATTLRQHIGAPLPPVEQPAFASVLTAARQQLREEHFTQAWDAGCTYSAIDLAPLVAFATTFTSVVGA